MQNAHARGGLQHQTFQNAFKNGPGGNDRWANGIGQHRVNARRIEGEGTMVIRSTTAAGTSEAPQTSLVPIISEHETAQEFSAVILAFTTGELAQAAKRGKEAAKKWKEGRSLPSAWSMMNMARELPAVRNYMLAKLGLGAHMSFNSPQGMDALVQAVHLVSTLQGPDGDAMRALLANGGKR